MTYNQFLRLKKGSVVVAEDGRSGVVVLMDYGGDVATAYIDFEGTSIARIRSWDKSRSYKGLTHIRRQQCR